MRRFRPARNQESGDADLEKARAEILARSRKELGRVRDVLERLGAAPTYTYRGHCEDCEGPVVLLDGTHCEICGSRSVILTSRAWSAPQKVEAVAA